MKELKLPESEWKVMDYLWEKGTASAKDTAAHMSGVYGWKKNTTYTILVNLIEKKILERREPGFLCRPLVAREQVGEAEITNLLQRFYKGSAAALFSSFLSDEKLSREELDQIRKMIEESDGCRGGQNAE